MSKEFKVKIEFSNRHIHPSKELVEKLFGYEYELKSEKKLSQGDDFAAEEKIELIGPSGSIPDVRVVGPEREKTQIEILLADNHKLGVNAPIKLSGDLAGSTPIRIIGPIDEVSLESGLIVAKRHLHMSTSDANEQGLKTGDIVKLKIEGERALIFDNVIVRVSDNFKTMAHIDTEEANAAGIKQESEGTILID
jgi:putative phosphotransacetylase